MQGVFDLLPSLLHGYGYITMFGAGLLFSFGFTTPFAIAIFVEMADTVHPVAGAIIAGLGAMASDLLIFQFIRFSFIDELKLLKTSALIRWCHSRLHRNTLPEQIQQYIVWSIAGIIIASPLPDELGVSLLSGSAKVQSKPFAAFCFALDSLGILIVLVATRSWSGL